MVDLKTQYDRIKVNIDQSMSEVLRLSMVRQFRTLLTNFQNIMKLNTLFPVVMEQMRCKLP